MRLHESVKIGRRFLRSIRIDRDLFDVSALDGFVCPQSFVDVFENMTHHIVENGHCAFTWTGPYGSGKSSLALGLSSLLSTDLGMRSSAKQIFDTDTCEMMYKALPLKKQGWQVLPIVGWRGDPIHSFGNSLKEHGFVSKTPRGGWTEKNLIDKLLAIANFNTEEHGGLIVIVDEMGKFLEGAIHSNIDIYFFQQLAEAASRSNGRLLVVAILHQAFQEYANNLSRELRDEWAKIQGRFVDLVVNVSGDEQIDLISRAIQKEDHPDQSSTASELVARVIYKDNSEFATKLASNLSNCWPIHPVVAHLLGGISRRRFSQNQRSVFGFLNSAEPFGFQDFLNRASADEIYGPNQLWDYLRANLEPTILASPDGHRWAIAAEALERCEYTGGDELLTQLLKTIAVIDLFKERSGLMPSVHVLGICLPWIDESALREALEQLRRWSLIVYRKHVEAYAIFAGSDFDIEEAISREFSETGELDCSKLEIIAGIQPIVAKRHYHETGALRWFNVNLVSLSNLDNSVKNFVTNNSRIGQFLLVIPTDGESKTMVIQKCEKLIEGECPPDVLIGYSSHNWSIVSFAKELVAVSRVKNHYSELAGDSVARREVDARLALLQAQVENRVQHALDSATWFHKEEAPNQYRYSELSALASDLANSKFHMSPTLFNELLNRDKPSGSAIGARKQLLHRMVMNNGERRLGIEGYPAEGGLFTSILQATHLYSRKDGRWMFLSPTETVASEFKPIWERALSFIKNYSSTPVAMTEIYEIWMAAPFGIKVGILPVVAVAFIQSQIKHLAIYREGVFRPQFDDLDVDYLVRDPSSVQVRWMRLSDQQRTLLSSIAEIVQTLDDQRDLIHLEPLDVARGLIRIFDSLPNFTKRTTRLSENTVRLRELLKRSKDPNKLIFEDLPMVFPNREVQSLETTNSRFKFHLQSGLDELLQTYPTMLSKLRDTMLTELQVPNAMPQSLQELQDRALNIQQLTGDFRVEAFVARIIGFDGSEEAFEGIASLVANKPARDWVDLDFDRALVAIAEISRSFLKAETFARVKDREEKRQAVAVMFGTSHSLTPITEEFYIRDTDQEAIECMIVQIEALLNAPDAPRREVILAALAELSARFIEEEESRIAS